ncbi:peroxisomal biogenesis factor 3 [Orussus abietinus]|uniref:peroxisomal biogenesis factor 3 n=1 Tax=Orussus abietinus TaxID=222816 RepID=UPI000626519D|nr:peroxisomal biogenesis factor 3 [Orussus abietinus]
MFSRLKGFLNRHKRKFIIGGVVIGGFVFITRYTQRKLWELHANQVREVIERLRRKQHFESTERTCNQTILSLAISLRDSVSDALNTEEVLNQLRNGCNVKVVAWNNLKVLAFSRSAVHIYVNAMLVATLRIQLNLLGGYLFKDSQNLQGAIKINEMIQQRYLCLCIYFMEEGVQKLSSFIKEKVEEVVASKSLAEKLSVRDLEQIYWAIVSSVSADSSREPVKNLTSYMLPPNCERESEGIMLKLINETLDLLESEEVQNLIRNSVRSGFVLAIDHISEYFTETIAMPNGSASVPAPSNQTNEPCTESVDNSMDVARYTYEFVNLHNITMPLAKIIPIIHGQVQNIQTKGDIPSDWMERLILNDKLKILGANVYEAFSF